MKKAFLTLALVVAATTAGTAAAQLAEKMDSAAVENAAAKVSKWEALALARAAEHMTMAEKAELAELAIKRTEAIAVKIDAAMAMAAEAEFKVMLVQALALAELKGWAKITPMEKRKLAMKTAVAEYLVLVNWAEVVVNWAEAVTNWAEVVAKVKSGAEAAEWTAKAEFSAQITADLKARAQVTKEQWDEARGAR